MTVPKKIFVATPHGHSLATLPVAAAGRGGDVEGREEAIKLPKRLADLLYRIFLDIFQEIVTV
jgi:hypothetical protein